MSIDLKIIKAVESGVYVIYFKTLKCVKIGMSVNIAERIKGLEKSWNDKIDSKKSFYLKFNNKSEMKSFEKVFHSMFSKYRATDILSGDGYTEMFSNKIDEELKSYIIDDKLLNNNISNINSLYYNSENDCKIDLQKEITELKKEKRKIEKELYLEKESLEYNKEKNLDLIELSNNTQKLKEENLKQKEITIKLMKYIEELKKTQKEIDIENKSTEHIEGLGIRSDSYNNCGVDVSDIPLNNDIILKIKEPHTEISNFRKIKIVGFIKNFKDFTSYIKEKCDVFYEKSETSWYIKEDTIKNLRLTDFIGG